MLCAGRWARLSREALDSFSAVSYFFAKDYAEKHGVAVGLVNASWGGSPAEAWMSREAVEDTYPYKVESARRYARDALCAQALSEARRGTGAWEQALCDADAGLKAHWEGGGEGFRQEITLPAAFGEDAALRGFCGALWFTRSFHAGPQWCGKPLKLRLGTITDGDRVYINGVFLGGTAYRYPPRTYAVSPGVIREGENTVVIRVVCNDGQGEVTRGKPFGLFDGGASIDLRGVWRYRTGARCGARPAELFLNREAFGLYNAMIHPAQDFPVRGVLFYQAESNDEKPLEYEALFKALIACWRAARGDQALPFIFVQLPLWGEPSDNNEGHAWAVLRNAQAAALSLPGTAMAVGLDAGEWNDLHPLDKKTIGRRLFLAAERLVHGADNSSPGPVPAGFAVRDGVLSIAFTGCAEGLAAAGGGVTVTLITQGTARNVFMKICGKDTLAGETGGGRIDRILYAWANAPKYAGLFNSEGLPAPPFRLTPPRGG
jgi:sialate O-acetylesterase